MLKNTFKYKRKKSFMLYFKIFSAKTNFLYKNINGTFKKIK